jgi:hypothetical protein
VGTGAQALKVAASSQQRSKTKQQTAKGAA